ncbi:MAG: Flp pilus assembly protein CpaB [Actinobacteria bacterium]|nr:Flp pilus assembly protein CpaB [Actinomycetota bacterium]
MSQRRTLILVAAIAVAMVAGFLVYNYVDGVEQDALGDAKLVSVYTVEAQIDRGASGEAAAEAIKQTNIPQQFKPANAITSLDDIAGKVAISDLAPGQVVVADLFVDRSDPAARKSNSDYLRKIRNEDMTAITISVDQVSGVAGLIEPGDYVNIMLRRILQGSTVDGADVPQSDTPILFDESARYLYQKAEVLAVDTTFVPQAGQTATGAATDDTAPAQRGLITLIVPAKAAQYIASVEGSRIYLTLVARDYKPVPQTPIDPSDPIPAEDGSQLTPYGADGPDNAS